MATWSSAHIMMYYIIRYNYIIYYNLYLFRSKKMNISLEKAIQEAMSELD